MPYACEQSISRKFSAFFGRMGRRWFLRGLVLLLCFSGFYQAFAHDPGLSSATLKLKPGHLEIELGFSLTDAEQILNHYRITDGPIELTETRAAAAALQKVAGQSLEVRANDHPVNTTNFHCDFDVENRNANINLKFEADTTATLVIRSRWLEFLPPGHRQFLSIQRADGVVLDERLLSANNDVVTIQCPPSTLEPYPSTSHNTFANFLSMGVKHIWTGYDHLLFLFGLLIVTRNFSSSIKIITCFTIAHSITLAVSTLSLVHISSRVVEPLIAASIVYVGIENLLRGDDPKGRWLLTFAFGLVHGFGFASVLRELGVGSDGKSIVVPLVSFNLGVELGQVVVAGLFLPVIWKLRTWPVFVRRWVPAGSVVVALLGTYWFMQRVLA
jgi:hydrogenase/urease accessory protein HupE